jgi:cupin fold WbuC family metalloprotein
MSFSPKDFQVNPSIIPSLSLKEIEEGLRQAVLSERKRYAKVLHSPGAEFNRVFNFLRSGTYMQPHMHPGEEKIEQIYLIEGKLLMAFFNDVGEISKTVILEKGGEEHISVPAFSWHTYAVLSEAAVTYETMMGVYDPKTWKTFASWAPVEQSPESNTYLSSLQNHTAH